jgi:hypothetical protein
MKGFFKVKESKPYSVIFVVQPDDEIVDRHGDGRKTNALTQPPVGHSHHKIGDMQTISGRQYRITAFGWHTPSQMFCSYTYQIDLELVK